MGKKGMKQADGFSTAVIEQIQKAIEEAGISKTELLRRTKISQDYFYVRMRGEKPFTTNDVSKIADALGIDAFAIFINASLQSGNGESAVTPPAVSDDEIKAAVNKKIENGMLGLAAMHDDDDGNWGVDEELA